jgi:hypothetical protein
MCNLCACVIAVAEVEAGQGETLDSAAAVQGAGLGGEQMDLGGTGLGERAEDLLALAAAALERGDWADARDAYQLALAVGEDAASHPGGSGLCLLVAAR